MLSHDYDPTQYTTEVTDPAVRRPRGRSGLPGTAIAVLAVLGGVLLAWLLMAG